MAEDPSSEPTAKDYSLREELAQHRGILRWFCAFRPGAVAPVRRGSHQNIEYNPMQSSRRPPQSTVWAEYSTRLANKLHNFIITKSDKRPRARNSLAAWECYRHLVRQRATI